MRFYDSLETCLSSGQIQRYHTLPTIGQESVAEHSYGVALIVLYLTEGTPGKLLQWALTHDVAEAAIGDVPAPVKWKHPILNTALEAIEEEFNQENNIEIKLTGDQKVLAKYADLLQMCWYALQQVRLGNHNMKKVFYNASKYILDELPRNERGIEMLMLLKEELKDVSE